MPSATPGRHARSGRCSAARGRPISGRGAAPRRRSTPRPRRRARHAGHLGNLARDPPERSRDAPGAATRGITSRHLLSLLRRADSLHQTGPTSRRLVSSTTGSVRRPLDRRISVPRSSRCHPASREVNTSRTDIPETGSLPIGQRSRLTDAGDAGRSDVRPGDAWTLQTMIAHPRMPRPSSPPHARGPTAEPGGARHSIHAGLDPTWRPVIRQNAMAAARQRDASILWCSRRPGT